jgi:protoheme IX farnesyltransferase
VTGTIDHNALILFLIIYVWTPPHFWALAIHRRSEYAAVDIPMLPVTHGVHFTRWHILFYTILLVIVTTMPYLTGMSGAFYLAGVTVLNAGFLWYALRLLRENDDSLPMQTFGYSIVYLMVLFGFLLVDHYLHMILTPVGAQALALTVK